MASQKNSYLRYKELDFERKLADYQIKIGIIFGLLIYFLDKDRIVASGLFVLLSILFFLENYELDEKQEKIVERRK